jgi:hypothetical protein
MRGAPAFQIVIVLVLLALPAGADVPQLLNYQGRLTDPSGTPQNGTFTMEFAVYDGESGGNQLPTASPWSETQNVTVNAGVFNVLLGSVTALPTELFEGGPSDSAGPLRFLQVKVSGETLAPRRRIVSAAYAIHANRDISARVYSTSSTTVPSGNDVQISFEQERWDTADLHDSDPPQNKYLITPTAGRYLINGHVSWAADPAGSRRVQIRLNLTTIIASQWQPPVGDNITNQSISTEYLLAAGDRLELEVSQTSGAPLDVVPNPQYSPEFGLTRLP